MEIISLSDEPADEKTHQVSGLVITAIKPAIKNEHRANIFINENYEFSLDLAQVVDYKLKVNQNLTVEKLNELKHASEFGKLYQRTLEWAILRPRSVKETRDHLREKLKKREAENRQIERNLERVKSETKEARTERKAREQKFGNRLKLKPIPLFSEDDIEKIIAKLLEKNYLDDYKFATYYLENKNAKKGTSLKKLRLELIKKGIEKNILDEIFAQDLRNDEEEIQKIIAKKRNKYDDEKLIQYLARQGFDFELARQAVCRAETD